MYVAAAAAAATSNDEVASSISPAAASGGPPPWRLQLMSPLPLLVLAVSMRPPLALAWAWAWAWGASGPGPGGRRCGCRRAASWGPPGHSRCAPAGAGPEHAGGAAGIGACMPWQSTQHSTGVAASARLSVHMQGGTDLLTWERRGNWWRAPCSRPLRQQRHAHAQAHTQSLYTQLLAGGRLPAAVHGGCMYFSVYTPYSQPADESAPPEGPASQIVGIGLAQCLAAAHPRWPGAQSPCMRWQPCPARSALMAARMRGWYMHEQMEAHA